MNTEDSETSPKKLTQQRNQQRRRLDRLDGGVVTFVVRLQLHHQNANDVDEKDKVDHHRPDHRPADDEDRVGLSVALPARLVRHDRVELEHQRPRADADGGQHPADDVVEDGEQFRVLVERCVQPPMEDEALDEHPVHRGHRGVHVQYLQRLAKEVVLFVVGRQTTISLSPVRQSN